MAEWLKGEMIFRWWRTIDRGLLVIVTLLILVGLLLSFAATTVIANKLSLPTYYFVQRNLSYLLMGIVILISVSFLSPEKIVKLSLYLLFIAICLLIVTSLWGIEIKGARRWLKILGFSFQPSEFLKPVFLVVSAYLMVYPNKRDLARTNILMFGLLFAVIGLLIIQPDYGQMILTSLVWGILLFLAGASFKLLLLLLSALLVGVSFAYLSVPHFHGRINSFLTGEGNTFQVELAKEAIISGGWSGVGPGEGKIKRIIPDSYTDFIFVVAAEEYGTILCIFILLLFLALLIRGLTLAMRQENLFNRLAACGLSLLIVGQALINISVNLNLIPSKGMTLPFISYGGSSLLASSLTVGLLLGLTRKYPKRVIR